MEIVSRSSAWLFWCLVNLILAVTSQQQPTVTVPNQNGDLNNYLCGNLSSTITNGMTLELNPDEQHIITGQSCLWQNRQNVAVQSSGDKAATVQCNSAEYTRSGFGFVEMSKFSLRNLRFENCGGIAQNASSFAPMNTAPRRAIDNNQHAVLFISHCTDVNIENVTFSNYRGYAIYAINLLGNTTLQQVTVTNSFAFVNRMTSSSGRDLMYSGSGVFFHFSNETSIPANNSMIIVNITNSVFSKNFNIYPDDLIHSLQETRLQNQPDDFPLHGAGGLTVHFQQQHRRVTAYIENVNFTDNVGSTGGGSQIVSRNTIDNSDIIFSGCNFTNNSVYNYSSFFIGGGLQLYFIFSYSKLAKVNTTAGAMEATIMVENSEFRKNRGEKGAAMAIYTEAQDVSAIKIELNSVHFIDNEATIDGDCIVVESENSATYSEKALRLQLESVHIHHTGRKNDLDSTAALSFNNIFVTINGTTENPSVISNGKNGALKLFDTYAFLTGEVQFTKNSATKGGAIAMEASSYLFFLEPANILFSNNEAETGGAIYSDIVRGSQCVMQFITLGSNLSVAVNLTDLKELDFNITFVDNRAMEDGHAIYAQPIYGCAWFSESIVQVPSDNVTDVYRELFHFKANQTEVSYREQMRSHPYRPCFCHHNETSMTPECTSDRVSNISISVPPGRSFDISIVPADVMWHPLRSVVEGKLVEENDIRFQNNRRRIVNDLNGTSCYPQKFVLRNLENSTATVQLSAQGIVGQFIKVNVILEDCPFGFELNETSGICNCVSIFANNNVKCDIENGRFIKPEGYWIGRTRNVPACVVKCPDGYCQRSDIVSLSFEDHCIGGHTGEICGRCKEGMSVLFGTTDCKKCTDFWLFTIILYILSGIFLVIGLFLLKLTISEGLLGSILFYAQLFSINLGLLVYSNETRFTTVFISLLNLELGFPLCFYNGMTQAGKYGLQFVYPIYLWLIVAVITVLSRYSSKLANLVGSECAKVFVTLIYFSYTKLLRTATSVFVPATIATNSNNYTVWYLDGGEEYFTGHHLYLGLVSLFFLTFILTPYKFFILLGQWCLHNSWVSRHFKPLIDATLAPFKDRWRFWFGLRLFVLDFLILISILVTPLNFDAVTYSHLVIVMLLLVFQAHIKPYKSKLLHYLDLFFLINYVLFLIGCLFIFEVLKPKREDQKDYVTAVEVLIIGSAFLVFVATVVCHVVIRMRNVYGLKRKGQMKPNISRDEAGTEMEDTLHTNSIHRNSDELRPQNVTLTVVDIRQDREDYDGARLRESLLGDY